MAKTVRKKTHSGASKRFSVTNSGKVKAFRQGRRKLLCKKTRARKRFLRAPFFLQGEEAKKMRSVLA
jgi:large subunit ribosomal protein L35